MNGGPRRLARFAPAALLAAQWAVVFAPFIAVGPNDLEDFYTPVVSTALAVKAMAAGAWPFWTADIGLGVPQPLRFHFITHPAAVLCTVADCHQVLRWCAALQLLGGAACVWALAARAGAQRWVAASGAAAYLASSTAVEDTFINDWPITVVAEATLPLMVYAGVRLFDGGRDRLRWAFVLGGVAGWLVSMAFPLVTLLIAGLFLLASPRQFWAHRRWLLIAAAVAAVIGAAHVAHLAEQVWLTPPLTGRAAHDEASLAVHAWSAFLRPLGSVTDQSWRMVFFGPPFAVLAVAALCVPDASTWPFKWGLAVSLGLMILPEAALANLMTSRWFFRSGINLFGILLAVTLLVRLGTHRWWRWAVPVLVVIQIAWQCVAILPAWRPVATVAIGHPEPDPVQRRLARTSPTLARLEALQAKTPGRLLVSLDATTEIRSLTLTRFGLAPNVFALHGVPTVVGLAHGITMDPLYPTPNVTGGPLLPPADAPRDRAFLDVLGIRYLLVRDGESVAPSLHDLGVQPGGLRLFENDAAWSEAFFVRRLQAGPLQRKAGCEHDRFYCADFSGDSIERTGEKMAIARRPDGVSLTFAAAARPRVAVVTDWNVPGWRVTPRAARLVGAAEQLIGLEIPAGLSQVDLTFLPMPRAALFIIGLVSQLVVACVCVFLTVTTRAVPAS